MGIKDLEVDETEGMIKSRIERLVTIGHENFQGVHKTK